MDIKAYIDSGILEQFVLGNTSPEETVQIIELSKSHPEIKAEIEAIEESLFKLAESFAKTPSAELKDRIMANLDSDGLKEVKITDNERPIVLNNTNTKGREFKMYNLFVAASIVLLGMSIVGNVWLYNNWKNTQNELASLSSENSLLTNNDKVWQTKFSEMEDKMAILLSPEIKPVVLKGLPLMPQALATVYWNPNKNEVYINANTLPETSENEQYQLWAIVDGKPQDAGVFNTEEALKGMVKMKDTGKATAFAITIEKKGGAINPTMEKMVLMGAVI